MSLDVHLAGHPIDKKAVRKGSKKMNGKNGNNTATPPSHQAPNASIHPANAQIPRGVKASTVSVSLLHYLV
ncbi:MAG: hypothetical protein ACXVH6_06130 [Halobacteriota archaeon]